MFKSYLKNIEAIAKTLSEEDLLICFKKLNKGEKDFRNVIIISNLGIVLNRIKIRFSKTNYDLEELFNIGTIGLIKSVDTFDMSKKNKFSTYAAVCIDNEILMFLRKNKNYYNVLSIDYSLAQEKNNCDFLISDTLKDKSKDFVLDYELREQMLHVDEVVEGLPEREREIIKLYYGFYGKIYSQEEISKIYNVSQSYISRIIRKTLLKLKIKLIKNHVIENKSIKTKNNYCIN